MVGQKARQLDFLHIVEKWRVTDIDGGTVVQLRSGDYQASINGGWWTAIRSTKDAAIKAVIKMYRTEIECYD